MAGRLEGAPRRRHDIFPGTYFPCECDVLTRPSVTPAVPPSLSHQSALRIRPKGRHGASTISFCFPNVDYTWLYYGCKFSSDLISPEMWPQSLYILFPWCTYSWFYFRFWTTVTVDSIFGMTPYIVFECHWPVAPEPGAGARCPTQ